MVQQHKYENLTLELMTDTMNFRVFISCIYRNEYYAMCQKLHTKIISNTPPDWPNYVAASNFRHE